MMGETQVAGPNVPGPLHASHGDDAVIDAIALRETSTDVRPPER